MDSKQELSLVIDYITVLTEAYRRLKNSSGWFVDSTKKYDNTTHFGLCKLIRTIIRFTIINNDPKEIELNIIVYLKPYAAKYGANINTNDGYWWEIGKIKHRLKTVKAALKALKHKKLLLNQRIYWESQLHI